jgi:membrane-bound lytic murein transglycosylase B
MVKWLTPAKVITIALALVIACATFAKPATRSQTEAIFRKWLSEELWPRARSAGVSRRTFDTAFSGVSINWNLPGLVPPGAKRQVPKEQHQAEFSSPARYFSRGGLSAVVAGGRRRAGQYGQLLGAIERKYGVPPRIILAIWGRESGFGGVSIPHNAFSVLATKAFMSTRPELFRGELIAALQILQEGDVAASRFKSSWAGALGQPQFMPTSFLKHAVDFDGDGQCPIRLLRLQTISMISVGSKGVTGVMR